MKDGFITPWSIISFSGLAWPHYLHLFPFRISSVPITQKSQGRIAKNLDSYHIAVFDIIYYIRNHSSLYIDNLAIINIIIFSQMSVVAFANLLN